MKLIAPLSPHFDAPPARRLLRAVSETHRDFEVWMSLKEHYRKWATYPPSWTNIKTQKWHWWGDQGAVAFSPVGRVLVVAGEPLGPGEKCDILKEFLNWAHSLGFRCTGYYTAPDLKSPGIKRTFCGTASLIHLRDFTLQGKKRGELRRALNQGARSNLQVEEIVSAPDKAKARPFLQHAYFVWRRTKGAFKIGFFLSEDLQSSLVADVEKWWVCWEKGEVAAYLTLLPYTSESGQRSYYVDQLIKNPSAHKFALDYLLARVLESLASSSVDQLSLGLNAFADCRLGLGTKGLMWGLGRLEFIYNSKGLRYFKNKFGLTMEEPRYLWRTKKTPAWMSWRSIAYATLKQN